jgi:hypothetical protein
MTALLNPESSRADQSKQVVRAGESVGNQQNELGLGSLPKSALANLVTTETAANVTAPAPNGGIVPPRDSASSSDPEEAPLPHAAGLISEVLPLDRAGLEQAIDQFFDQLEELGVGQLVEHWPVHVIPLSVVAIGTVTAAEIARRQLRSKKNRGYAAWRQDPLGSEELRAFPELPGSWSTRLT